jgi:hypothetical protein
VTLSQFALWYGAGGLAYTFITNASGSAARNPILEDYKNFLGWPVGVAGTVGVWVYKLWSGR